MILASARGGSSGVLAPAKPTLNCCGAENSNRSGITTECVNPAAGVPTPKLRQQFDSRTSSAALAQRSVASLPDFRGLGKDATEVSATRMSAVRETKERRV